jgi:hypothetical protein
MQLKQIQQETVLVVVELVDMFLLRQLLVKVVMPLLLVVEEARHLMAEIPLQ